MDKVLHVLVGYALTLTLRVAGGPAWLSIGVPMAGAAAWEIRQPNESRVEHQQDLVAGISGMLAAEAIWENAEDRARRKRACAVLGCNRPKPKPEVPKLIITDSSSRQTP